MNDPVVTIGDMRAAKLCSAGGRRVAAAYGLSWNTFITEGYPASVLEATNDPLILRMVGEARKRTAREG